MAASIISWCIANHHIVLNQVSNTKGFGMGIAKSKDFKRTTKKLKKREGFLLVYSAEPGEVETEQPAPSIPGVKEYHENLQKAVDIFMEEMQNLALSRGPSAYVPNMQVALNLQEPSARVAHATGEAIIMESHGSGLAGGHSPLFFMEGLSKTVRPMMESLKQEITPKIAEKVEADMEKLKTALVRFREDNNAFPRFSKQGTKPNGLLGPDCAAYYLPCFCQPLLGPSLTTPLAYLDDLPYDPFAPVMGTHYIYYFTPLTRRVS